MGLYKGHLRLYWNLDVGWFMLVFLLSLVWAWRTVMFQLFGVYCISGSWPLLGLTCENPKLDLLLGSARGLGKDQSYEPLRDTIAGP